MIFPCPGTLLFFWRACLKVKDFSLLEMFVANLQNARARRWIYYILSHALLARLRVAFSHSPRFSCHTDSLCRCPLIRVMKGHRPRGDLGLCPLSLPHSWRWRPGRHSRHSVFAPCAHPQRAYSIFSLSFLCLSLSLSPLSLFSVIHSLSLSRNMGLWKPLCVLIISMQILMTWCELSRGQCGRSEWHLNQISVMA